ncbi:MAG: T9SS type A sorting domain-containing protein [Bacteroidales bacterium]
MKKAILIFFTFWVSLPLFSQIITGINPNQGVVGSTLNVTITGVNTHFTQATNTVRFYFTGATSTATYPNGLFVLSDTSIAANITIPTGTALGWHSFSVSNFFDGYMLTPNAFKVTTPVGIVAAQAHSGFDIHPNPFSDRLTLKLFTPVEETALLRIFSTEGKLVEEQRILLQSGTNEIPLNLNLKPGTYYAVVVRSDGSTLKRKLIRQ